MGAFDNNDKTIEIHSKHWDNNEMVEARVGVTLEDEEWVNNQLLKLKQAAQSNKGKKQQQKQGLEIEFYLGATRRLWIERMIVRWTLTKGGMPVPLSSLAIKQLPTHYADFIYDQIMEAQPVMSEEEEEDFLGDAETPSEEL